METCPFCINKSNDEDSLVNCIKSKYPVSDGHLLVIPSRHVSSIEELNEEEYHLLFTRVKEEIKKVKSDPDVNGVNMGINSGLAAGQTIYHAHVHIIPRRFGDIDNPRGGVRGVIPDKKNY